MLIKLIINKISGNKELIELEKERVNLNRTINKHRRRLIRLQLYLFFENRYQTKKIRLFLTRLFFLRIKKSRRNTEDLNLSFNYLIALISQLKANNKEYLSKVKLS